MLLSLLFSSKNVFMDKKLKGRALRIVKLLKKAYPDAKCALVHKNPLELLVATILSAQCTDVRVNIVTKELFQKYRTAENYANANLEKFEQEIRSTGFYRNKAKNIIGAAKLLVERCGGKVPPEMDVLTELPGVARKTANVVLGTAFGIASGVVVDTHVHRISHLLRITEKDDPNKIEQDLMTLIPQSEWIHFSHAVIWHGRRVCIANRPKCGECVLAKECPTGKEIIDTLKGKR